MQMRLAVTSAVMLAVGGFGCKDSGKSPSQAALPVELPAVSLTESVEGCSGLRTTADLLTPEVRNGAEGSRLSYELAVVDCEGHRQPFGNERILFDVEAEIGHLLSSPYSVSAGDASLSGALESVEGEDMFGRKGPEYFHHRTDRTLSSTSTDALILTIELSGQNFYPIGGGNERHFSAKTHLKIGRAAPVTRTVMFLE